jgi:hypothetical protein
MGNLRKQIPSIERDGRDEPSREHAGELCLSAGFGDDRRARRAGVNRERADEARKHAACAKSQKIAVDVWLGPLIIRKGAGGGGGLHHDNQCNDDGEPEHLRKIVEGDSRERRMWKLLGDRPQDGDAFFVEVEVVDRESRAYQSDECARYARTDLFADYNNAETGHGDRYGAKICMRQSVCNFADALGQVAVRAWQAEHRGRLRHNDVDGDAG